MSSNNKPACINCKFFKTGWFHPKCNNPKSDKHTENVNDDDKCNKFESKFKPVKPLSSTLADLDEDDA